jgi:hypothetical protein
MASVWWRYLSGDVMLTSRA